jgi:hypothetical protein
VESAIHLKSQQSQKTAVSATRGGKSGGLLEFDQSSGNAVLLPPAQRQEMLQRGGAA